MLSDKLYCRVKTCLATYGITTKQQIAPGEMADGMCLATRRNQRLVIKIGFSELGKHEIRQNLQGYKNLDLIGANSLIPNTLEFYEHDQILFLVMSDCGMSFREMLVSEKQPAKLFQRLIGELLPIYQSTEREAVAALDSLSFTRNFLAEQYRQFLLPEFQEESTDELVNRLLAINLEIFRPARACFATFDLTPSSVFLCGDGLRFTDPQPLVVGIPIIDLACFAGVCRDSQKLPGSAEGYAQLERYALTDITAIVGLSRDLARKLFVLGRALQCALSSRFSIGRDDNKAREMYFSSLEHLRNFLDNS